MLREHPLDGAMLYFRPETGLHVRVQGPATRELRRRAPRVAMFGITNACNLRCHYCSRDASAPSGWTAEGALAMLEGLDRAGTLEVAFGGGEPFLFPGFLDLLCQLRARTRLAVHVTTNGTRLADETLAELPRLLGILRLSLHEDAGWRATARRLRAAGVRWGANALVTPRNVDALPALLDELAGLGARDGSVLSYVGPDPALHLDAAGDAAVAAALAAAPLPARLSVCFGGRVPVPRLFDGADGSGDCGAGRDFVTLTPDRRMMACSFHRAGPAVRTAEDVLEAWEAGIPGPSPRRGCARPGSPIVREDLEGVRVWHAYSGNNSGECVLVARFEDVAAAEAYYARLHGSGGPFPQLWRDPRAYSYSQESPREMVGLGRRVLALAYHYEDAMAWPRELAWEHGGIPSGRWHVHDPLALAYAVEAAGDAGALEGELGAVRHGTHVYGVRSLVQDFGEGSHALVAAAEELFQRAAGHPVAATIVEGVASREVLLGVAKRLGVDRPRRARAVVRYWEARDAERFAAQLNAPFTRLGGLILVETPDVRRIARAALSCGGSTYVLSSETVAVELHFRGRHADEAALVDAISRVTGITAVVAPDDGTGLDARFVTSEPGRVLSAAAAAEADGGVECSAQVSEVDPLGALFRELREEVGGGS